MPNPLFNALGGNMMPQGANNNFVKLAQDFVRFKNSFRGDARQEVMNILQSGRISQQDLNDLQAQAQQLQQIFKQMK